MSIIRCQHEWVEQCQLRYKVESPAGYHFEEAHYPLSRKLGGTSTVSLWFPDHIIQGCLQTLNLDFPCLDTRQWKVEREIVKNIYPDYLSIYDEAYKKCKSHAGKSRAANTNAFLHKEKTPEGKSRHAVMMGMKTLTSGALRKAIEVRSSAIQVTEPNGTVTTFPSIREASKFYKLDRRCVAQCLAADRAISRGKNKGLTFLLM